MGKLGTGCWCLFLAVAPEARRNHVVQLHENNERDAPIGVEETQQSAQCVPGLSDQDTTLERVRDMGRNIALHQVATERAYSGPKESQTQ